MKKDMSFLSFEKLLTILDDLGQIEEKVKLENDDIDDLLELFIVSFNDYRKRR